MAESGGRLYRLTAVAVLLAIVAISTAACDPATQIYARDDSSVPIIVGAVDLNAQDRGYGARLQPGEEGLAFDVMGPTRYRVLVLESRGCQLRQTFEMDPDTVLVVVTDTEVTWEIGADLSETSGPELDGTDDCLSPDPG